jgi:hypothetical protein
VAHWYIVQPGDSPARIAARQAGCPKCAIDLVVANPHKPAVRYPNGFVTFRELRVGERLALPDKWFSGALDRLPRAYFESLPSADGRLGTGAATPTIAHCHSFSGTIAVLVVAQGSTPDAALATVLSSNGFTNYFAGPVQNQVASIQGVWEGASLLDTSKPLQDPTGTNAAAFQNVTDGGLAHPKSGPCAAGINPQAIQKQSPPPKAPPPQKLQPPAPAPATSSTSSGLGWGLAALAAGGTIVFVATRKPRR